MQIDDENVKISIIFPRTVGNLLANATVAFNTVEYGFITVKGFQIWRSSIFNDRLGEDINIIPPSRPVKGKYLTFVFIENKERYYELQSRIYDAYHIALSKQGKKKINEDVDPNDIPL